MLNTLTTRYDTYEEYCTARYSEEREHNRVNKILTTTGIDDYLEKNPDITRAQVEAELATNDLFVREFIKDPVTQNCYERFCIEYITMHAPGKCEKLKSNSRKTSLYLYKGKVYLYNELPDEAKGHVKSIDIKVTYKDYTIYISNKHTRKDGGAQNNQWHDLDVFGEHACMSTEDKVILIALADGEYYTKRKKNGRTKLDLLNDRANEHFCAMTTTEFCSWLLELR
jgi:hypothetical protein